MMHRFRLPLFGLISGLLCLLAFPGAISGKAILAPLDIFPNLFEHFRFMDPAASGIPANHHIIDQATYDLPLQYRIYQSLREGVFPWWDPYTYGGRPLLADAHINGTDPIRLICYFLLPFPTAYNLNLILKSILTGFGMLLLLRHLGHPWFICGVLALSFQFAGCFALNFGHPWVQASLLYYPFLWISLDRLINRPTHGGWLATSFLCALIFYCGNLQSHAYLFLFNLAYMAAPFCQSRQQGLKTLFYTFLSTGWGALLAAPVLLNQIEFFLLSTRTVIPGSWSIAEVFRGPLSLSGVFPWLLGTFRTLDLSKAVGLGNLGFSLFVGSVPFVLATIGATVTFFAKRTASLADRAAVFLVVGYLVQISTPLGNFFYTRLSPLACLGLAVLAATAIRWSLARPVATKPSLFRTLAVLSMLLAGFWVGELWLFHHFRDSIQAYFLEKVAADSCSVVSVALRLSQVSAFTSEVGSTNPEVAFSWLSLICLLAFYFKWPKKSIPQLLYTSLVLSLLSVFLFFGRFTPCQSIILWKSLRDGGAAQQQAAQKVAGSHGRLMETAPNFQNQVFPNAVASLYGVHVVHGYSALQPRSLANSNTGPKNFPDAWLADWIIVPRGDIRPVSPVPKERSSCRWIWDGPEKRTIRPLLEAPGRLVLELSPGPAGRLIRTDTDYPGWVAMQDHSRLSLESLAPFFSFVKVAANPSTSVIAFTYTPRFFAVGLGCAALSLICLLANFPIFLGRRASNFSLRQPDNNP